MSGKASLSAQRERRQRQRTRAVLFEGDRERAQEAQWRQRSQGERVNLAHLPSEQLVPYPLLTADLAEHSGFAPRSRTGSASDAAPRLARLQRMLAYYGELVLLTWNMRSLDRLGLKTEALAQAARKSVDGMFRLYAPRARAYDVTVGRGPSGCTHAHIVMPLADLARTLQATALAAPPGRGSGTWHIPEKLHAVRISDMAEDLERVAGYLSRDPDGRLDLPDEHPDFLQALEDELTRKLLGGTSPRLSWFKLPRVHRTP